MVTIRVWSKIDATKVSYSLYEDVALSVTDDAILEQHGFIISNPNSWPELMKITRLASRDEIEG